MSIETLIPAIQGWLTTSFNPEQVFSSFSHFLGSGYVGIAVVAFLVISILNKLTKLIAFAFACVVIYIICTSGNFMQIVQQLQGLMP